MKREKLDELLGGGVEGGRSIAPRFSSMPSSFSSSPSARLVRFVRFFFTWSAALFIHHHVII